MARQCFANAVFEMNAEEGFDLVEEFHQVESSHQSGPESDPFNLHTGLKKQ
jgi:hypothetical protein